MLTTDAAIPALVDVPATKTFDPTLSALELVAWPLNLYVVDASVVTVVLGEAKDLRVNDEPLIAVTTPAPAAPIALKKAR